MELQASEWLPLNGVPQSICYSPDGRWLATGHRDRKLLTGSKAAIKESGVRGTVVIHMLSGVDAAVTTPAELSETVSIPAPGTTKTVSIPTSAEPSEPGTPYLAEVPTYESIASVGSGPTWKMSVSFQHDSGVNCAAFAPDCKCLAAADSELVVLYMHDTDGWTQARTLSHWGASFHSLWCVAFSPDGKFLAAGSDDASLVVFETHLQTSGAAELQRSRYARSVAFSPNSKWLASGSDTGQIVVYQCGKIAWFEIVQLSCFGGITSLVFSPNCAWLAASCTYEQIVIYETKSWQVAAAFHHGPCVRSLSFSEDSRWLAGGLVDNGAIVYETVSWQIALDIHRPHGDATSLCFSPVGGRLAVGGQDVLNGACVTFYNTDRLPDIWTERLLNKPEMLLRRWLDKVLGVSDEDEAAHFYRISNKFSSWLDEMVALRRRDQAVLTEEIERRKEAFSGKLIAMHEVMINWIMELDDFDQTNWKLNLMKLHQFMFAKVMSFQREERTVWFDYLLTVHESIFSLLVRLPVTYQQDWITQLNNARYRAESASPENPHRRLSAMIVKHSKAISFVAHMANSSRRKEAGAFLVLPA